MGILSGDNKTWIDRLTRGAFRGTEFLTESHEARGGNRLVVSEFPGADVPDVQDLGAKAGHWRLNAYFIGPDYDLERNGFLAKLAAPGPDWLTHPWLGLLWVRVLDWSVHESNAQGGFATVSVDFVPGGESLQPVADGVDVCWAEVQTAAQALQDGYAPKAMSADAFSAFRARVDAGLEKLRQVVALSRLPLAWAQSVTGLILGVKGDLAALLATPAAYATALRSVADALGGGAEEAGLSDMERPRVVARLAALAQAPLPTAGREEAVLRAGLMALAAAGIALTKYRAAGDRDAALASALAAMDGVLPHLGDVQFQAVTDARASLITALNAQALAPAVVRMVANPLPATVLAYRLGVSEEVFKAQNAVRHPLFVEGVVRG
jgi:prophage DNA circulation protein